MVSMPNRIWQFIKRNFLSRKFITFAALGVVNTGIDMLVYLLFYNLIVPDVAFLAKGVAFLVASVFSYFANAAFTFRPSSRTTVQFTLVMTVFLVRWGLTMGLAALIDHLVIVGLGIDYASYPIAKLITPFFSSALMIPVAYLVLDVVFRRYGKSARS